MKTPSKYSILLSGILAFVLSLSAILFLILGFVYDSYETGGAGTYLLGAGLALFVLSLIFISGLVSLKKHPGRGRKLLMTGSALSMLFGILPVWQLVGSLAITSTRIFILAFVLLLYLPFAWLFYYLWKL